LYDIGFPFPRSWLYAIGGFIVVIATFAIGYFLASRHPLSADRIEEQAVTAADSSPDDVLVARAIPERPQHLPAFAPEGVIVVAAPSRDEPTIAEVRERIEQPSDRVERARSRARANERRPAAAVARAESSAPGAREVDALPEPQSQARADEQPTQSETPSARESEEAEYADADAAQAESDNRSWYGSAEYRREVAERQRAEREARRRRNDGR
jgi:hypothetical protein